MADDYTPTTEEVIRKYATGATWQHQSFSAAEDEFIRWLAAHDAEKRAEWGAEPFECPNCLIDVTPPAPDPKETP